MRFLRPFLLLAAFGFAPNAHAAIIFSIGSAPATIDAGTSVTLPFQAYITAPITNPLESYQVTVDFGGDGDALPSFLSGTPTFSSSLATGNFFSFALPATGDFDYLVNWGGASEAISTDSMSPTTLFTVTFDTNPLTPSGTYDVEYGTGTNDLGLTSASANGILYSPGLPNNDIQLNNPGQFTINASAVPEPGSVLTLAGVFVAGGVRHWRRRRRGAAEAVAA